MTLAYQKGKNCASLQSWKYESMTMTEGIGIPKDGPHFTYCFQGAAETAQVQGGPSLVRAEPHKLGKWVSFLLYRRRNETDIWGGWNGPDFQFIRKFAEKNGSLKRGKSGFHLKFLVSCQHFLMFWKSCIWLWRFLFAWIKQLGKSGSFHEHFCLIRTPGFPLRSLIPLTNGVMLIWRIS